MYYKSNYKNEDKKFIKENPLEFALVLAEKTKGLSNYETGFLIGLDKDNNRFPLKAVVFNKESYFTHRSTAILSNNHKRELIAEAQKPQLINVEFERRDFKNLEFNKKIKQKMLEILNDFFISKLSTFAKDKFNNNYEIKIINNTDPTIIENLIVDELSLIFNNKKIGYLKAKYTTHEINSKLEMKDNLFLNTATIDYASLDPEFKNRGLGYVMYFHMAQYLSAQGIDFRKSTLQSPSAQKLWDGIENHWKDNIIKKTFEKETHVFLKMTQNINLYFEDKVPVLKNTKI